MLLFDRRFPRPNCLASDAVRVAEDGLVRRSDQRLGGSQRQGTRLVGIGDRDRDRDHVVLSVIRVAVTVLTVLDRHGEGIDGLRFVIQGIARAQLPGGGNHAERCGIFPGDRIGQGFAAGVGRGDRRSDVDPAGGVFSNSSVAGFSGWKLWLILDLLEDSPLGRAINVGTVSHGMGGQEHVMGGFPDYPQQPPNMEVVRLLRNHPRLYPVALSGWKVDSFTHIQGPRPLPVGGGDLPRCAGHAWD